jgi:hypothetical protein
MYQHCMYDHNEADDYEPWRFLNAQDFAGQQMRTYVKFNEEALRHFLIATHILSFVMFHSPPCYTRYVFDSTYRLHIF